MPNWESVTVCVPFPFGLEIASPPENSLAQTPLNLGALCLLSTAVPGIQLRLCWSAELEPSPQIFVACQGALEALRGQLRLLRSFEAEVQSCKE